MLEARAELPDTVAVLAAQRLRRGRPRRTAAHDGAAAAGAAQPADAGGHPGGRASGSAALARAGDLLILTGDLGAGKTTLTQGLGEGLGVRGPVTSPTFVIARVHPSLSGGPALVHVDAYRLGDAAELDDLDLDTDLDEAVTVVEWGSGLAEALSSDRLELRLERAADDVRTADPHAGRRPLARRRPRRRAGRLRAG